ncbi:MAG: S46 family peptidase, partial [Gemmatimonadaceae bacterium]
MSPIRLRRGALVAALLVASGASAQVASPNATTRSTSARPAPQAARAQYRKEFGTMWTFDAPPLDYWRTRYGFTPDQAWLDHVRLAAVRLPGCSASFVSPRGLVMTNHHCARECVVSASPPDTNYLHTGFAAASPAQEKKCDGLYVDQLQSIEDVTARVRGAATSRLASDQVAQRGAAAAAIEKECRDRTGLTCQVVSFYQGGRYSLYTYRRFSDVRFVMAPEEDIGFFGGDPDNFTFPRYDLDMSFLRVYENDRPYQPPHFLKWSPAGAADSEPVFVVGNPGSTGRLLTVAQMEYLRDVQYPAQLAGYRRTLAALREASKSASPEKQREYENLIFGYENSLKAVTGYRAGLLDSALMARKTDFERDFRARVNADPALRARYAAAWDNIARAQRELATLAPYTRWVGFGGGSTLWSYAGGIVRLPAQGALADTLRLPQYRGTAIETVRRTVTSGTVLDTAFERRALAATFAAAKDELGASDPYVRAVLAGRTPEEAAAALVSGTTLGDPAARRALVEGGAAAVSASKDPV